MLAHPCPAAPRPARQAKSGTGGRVGDPEANLYYYGILFCVHCITMSSVTGQAVGSSSGRLGFTSTRQTTHLWRQRWPASCLPYAQISRQARPTGRRSICVLSGDTTGLRRHSPRACTHVQQPTMRAPRSLRSDHNLPRTKRQLALLVR